MKIFYFIALLFISTEFLQARIREVGEGREFNRLQAAATGAQPGDTILIHEGVYSGGDFISNLQGTAEAWITIRAADGESVIFRGNSQAFHLSDPAYVRIEGLIFEKQTGNGVNIDDAASFETPAHHIIIDNCEWRSMDATGNNDELKMSGVDDFVIRNCRFSNGSLGGSLIDMVGCHKGIFEDNYFENGGSNCIQAKGATSDITITRNKFLRGGARAINIGGSTGLEFFRPQGALYEASNIRVYSNIFKDSQAPIAFVGAVNCEVVNNTIIRPDRWVIRILQETVEPGFLPCGNNIFRNNIIVFGNTGQPAINIGSNTDPESFTFSNNLWFNPDNASWSGPNTPVVEENRILNQDPQFADTNYLLKETSPAIGKGFAVIEPKLDFFKKSFAAARSIGAIEAETVLTVENEQTIFGFLKISPNPANKEILVTSDKTSELIIMDIFGRKIWSDTSDKIQVHISSWPAGVYFVRCGRIVQTFVKQ